MSKFDFSKCPHCKCEHFYRQKDFNRAIGCLVILIGAVFVPLTYGLSLVIVAIADWILYPALLIWQSVISVGKNL